MTPRQRAASRMSRRLSRSAASPPRRSGAPVPPSAAASPAAMTFPMRSPDEARAQGAGRDLETLPADVAADLVAGRLSQRCPQCGTTEAAGGHCTACFVVTGPADWFRQEASDAQRAARQAKGRDRAENGATAAKSPPPEPLELWSA